MKKSLLFLFVFLFISFNLSAEYVDYKTAVQLLTNTKPTDFPEADQASIENTKIVLDEKCLDNTVHESYTKILTERGKQYLSYAYFSFNSDYDTVVVNLIEVIKPDGTVNKIEPDKVLKLMNQSAFTGFMNIYSETSWLLIGALPNISVGDIVHKTYTTITHNAPMDNNWSDQIQVENYSPVLKQYYELSFPKDININVHYLNKKDGYVDFSNAESDGNKIYKFDIGNPPHIIYEPFMEQSDKFSYYIVLTTIKSWQDISKWYYSLVAPHLKIDDAIKDTVKSLIKDCKTKEEKLTKLFYWVSPSIRYLGVDREKGKPGFEPHDVAYTFSTRGGVCRDKSALLVSMLREAGIPADPILIAAGYQLNPMAPTISFNHAVVVSYDEKGNPEYFYDPTAETTKDLFPQYEEDCSYVIASEKGDDLKLVPFSKASRNNSSIDLKINVADDFSANCSLKETFKGLSDSYIRDYLMKLNPQKIKEDVERMITSLHPLAEIIDYTVTDPKDKEKNIEFSVNFKIPNYINKDGKSVYIPLEAAKLTLSPTYYYSLYAFQLNERKYPFKMNGTFSINVTEELKVPFQLNNMDIPKVPNIDYKGFSLTQDSKLLDNSTKLLSTTTFASENIHYSVEDYKLLKTKLAALDQLEKLYIIGTIK